MSIAEVLRLDAQATQGPWEHHYRWGNIYDESGDPPFSFRRGETGDRYDGAAIVGADNVEVIHEGTFGAYDQTAGVLGAVPADAALIAYYRTAAPALAREVRMLQITLEACDERSQMCLEAEEEAEAELSAALDEIRRLQACALPSEGAYIAGRVDGERIGLRAGQEAMRERAATLCEDWEEDSYCEGWREMEQGAQHCADAIRALEVE